MKVLIYDVDCKSSGIEYPIKEALEKMGHQTIMFDWTLYFKSISNGKLIYKITDKLLIDIIQMRINKQIRKIVHNNHFDLFLVMRGDHLYPETLEFCRNKINKIVNWNTDDLFNKLNSSKLIIDSVKYYDVHFSPRFNLKNEYLDKGARTFKKLDWYYRYGLNYDTLLNSPINHTNESTFIGSWSERRETLLNGLEDFNVNIFGWGWNKNINKSKYKHWNISPSISILQMHNEFNKSKINLNILTHENRDSTNLRNFEIPASGGFQLTERSDEILEIFEEDKDIVCFSSKDELLDKYLFYIKNDSLRDKIAKAGMNKVFQNKHSLIDRLDEILKFIKE